MATQTQTETQAGAKTYVLEGTLLEACSCRTLCRCTWRRSWPVIAGRERCWKG